MKHLNNVKSMTFVSSNDIKTCKGNKHTTFSNTNTPATTYRSQNEFFSPASSTRDLLILSTKRKDFDKPSKQPCGDDAVYSEFEYENTIPNNKEVNNNSINGMAFSKEKSFSHRKLKQNDSPSPISADQMDIDINSYYIESRNIAEDLSSINEKTKMTMGIAKTVVDIIENINSKSVIVEPKDSLDITDNIIDIRGNIIVDNIDNIINENENDNDNIYENENDGHNKSHRAMVITLDEQEAISNKLSIENVPNLIKSEDNENENDKNNNLVKKSKLNKTNERICRVCLEPDLKTNASELITPCKCTGTVKYIHHECLKKWILASSIPIHKAKCELCHTNFIIEIEEKKHYCTKKKYTKKEYQILLVIGILFILLYVLLHLMVIMILQIQDDMGSNANNAEKYFVFKWIVICVCSFFCTVLLFSIYYMAKKLCITKKSINWRVLEYSDISQKNMKKGKKLKKLILSLNSQGEEILDAVSISSVNSN